MPIAILAIYFRTTVLSTRAAKEQQARYDARLALDAELQAEERAHYAELRTRDEAILAKSDEQLARSQALMERQESVLSQAEQLLKRLDDRLMSG
ncbi:MAG: hypothetical protein AABP62_29080 [Planctomycetota bacterium]